jgi:fructosamine-3-kinase
MMAPVSEVHRKRRPGPEADRFFATEAAGLAWIRVPGGPPVPDVVEPPPGGLGITRIREGRPTTAAAEELGRRLAVMHAAGAPAFGAAPPDAPGPDGWIGDLPMPYADRTAFTQFWALDRIGATARMARDRGGLTATGVGEVDRFVEDLLGGQVDAGPAEPAARLHGDLWSGNVLWGADGRAWLIDPAAHGGHRESDLAMLALFPAPHLEAILAGYQQAWPLAPGWRQRIPLHQAWPLLVHAALFGGGYGSSALQALRLARG